jgi:hypothetical protein
MQSEFPQLGIPGLTFEAGDHICAFYLGLAERDEVLMPYLRAGLQAGDKCICVVDATDPAAVLAHIGAGIDVEGCVASHQLDLRKSSEAYFPSGRFSTDEMIAFWDESVGAAMSGGLFPFARSAGEMTWALRELPGVQELIDYESELNRFMPRYPQTILCLYDLERFGGGMLVDLLKTHPKLLLGGLVLENPHYLTPDEFHATRQ